ncbi:tRNA (adenosine(37)-N6)-threonylcarbamoyltransferase complex dimerization subunit type 1 TsaB [Pseudoxanthomonas suwonensis]|uniref:tRNA (adenosine(37)-N6)-threonylcarbamoyltransferase complex dimerization subunit type 1 TsaB n=1 Tax=Pseudoxanthomonas suwonensis TaxID=314722 RepID=UPI00138F138C|nr:tRNA (adenosine(37)-N6)-threonylcarbamoyltransferase complex dimerization subunit type 1 TsaB [Pseudoxanthomonas suwonensis]KAF1705621.1 tRNA (adenosine(37)-N6)-threonylcarbamoyltransferase complex dimerization subunit type 1 TsaB [Pseudoxanthomonas suwonensis]
MKLLAFETATEACSVALYLDGQVIERFGVAPRRHAELALPWAQELLQEAGIARAQLDAIAVGRGPGAFTGVRLAIALAQGIALALERPLVPVSTLQVLAAGAAADGPDRILAAIDARMGEVYVGAYERNGGRLVALDREQVLAPAEVMLPAGEGRWQGVGTGFAAADGLLARRLADAMGGLDAAALPRASVLAQLAAVAYAAGEAVAAERVEPAYLRDNVALTLSEQQALRASR